MLGFETVTFAPLDRNLIDLELLTGPEQRWVDAYHAACVEKLGPGLSPDERAWLEATCAPLGTV